MMCKSVTMRRYLSLAALLLLARAPVAEAQPAGDAPVTVTIESGGGGAKIDRNIFGQFAEHLGTGIYDGVWVGRDSAIPNVRGIRSGIWKALSPPPATAATNCFPLAP